MSEEKNTQQQEEEQVAQQPAEEKKEENLDYKEAWMRATADYKNLKKDLTEMQAEYVKYANEKMLHDLLPVIEHFHQGLKYIPEEHKSADWMMGFQQIKKQLDDFMEKNHLARIETVGKQFDAKLHEAMSARAEEGKESGEILEEVMGGYTLNDKVIQAARVIVAE